MMAEQLQCPVGNLPKRFRPLGAKRTDAEAWGLRQGKRILWPGDDPGVSTPRDDSQSSFLPSWAPHPALWPSKGLQRAPEPPGCFPSSGHQPPRPRARHFSAGPQAPPLWNEVAAWLECHGFYSLLPFKHGRRIFPSNCMLQRSLKYKIGKEAGGFHPPDSLTLKGLIPSLSFSLKLNLFLSLSQSLSPPPALPPTHTVTLRLCGIGHFSGLLERENCWKLFGKQSDKIL